MAMQVKLYPNPTVSDFKLQVQTEEKQAIRIRVLDMQGHELQSSLAPAWQVTNIGSGLGAGAYLLEVTQGAVVKTVKLLKF